MDYTLHHGDCLEVLRTLPSASVDACVTDPPYAATAKSSAFMSVGARSSVPREYQFYESWLREILAEIARVLSPSGALWMTIDWRGAMALDAACAKLGLHEPKIGVWDRGGLGMGNILRNVYECFAIVPMSGWKRKKTDEPDVWAIKWTPSNRKSGHSAEKPVELMSRAISLLCGGAGTVLDPFTGSGATGVAAMLEGFDFIGIERDADYLKIAEARIAAASGQERLAI